MNKQRLQELVTNETGSPSFGAAALVLVDVLASLGDDWVPSVRQVSRNELLDTYDGRLSFAKNSGRPLGCLPALVEAMRDAEVETLQLITMQAQDASGVLFLTPDDGFLGCFVGPQYMNKLEL